MLPPLSQPLGIGEPSLPCSAAGDYKCDGCPDAQPRPDDKGFRCKPMASMALDAQNRLSTRDPAMQVRPPLPHARRHPSGLSVFFLSVTRPAATPDQLASCLPRATWPCRCSDHDLMHASIPHPSTNFPLGFDT